MIFQNIKDINLKSKIKNNIYITFDIDWASDEVLSHTLDIIEKYNIKATFFVTHATKLLQRMINNPNIELGIHPNFNPLVNGDFRYGRNIKEVLEYYLKIVPDAVSIRSHDLMQKSELINLLATYNIKYDCNLYLPYNSGIVNKPFNHFDNKLIRVPHFWEDDVHCLYNDDWGVDKYLKYDGIKVFDFHPIHIALNSESMDRYMSIRDKQQDSKVVFENRFDGYGSEKFLHNLVRMIQNEK
jgi:hypothetical protein